MEKNLDKDTAISNVDFCMLNLDNITLVAKKKNNSDTIKYRLSYACTICKDNLLTIF